MEGLVFFKAKNSEAEGILSFCLITLDDYTCQDKSENNIEIAFTFWLICLYGFTHNLLSCTINVLLW